MTANDPQEAMLLPPTEGPPQKLHRPPSVPAGAKLLAGAPAANPLRTKLRLRLAALQEDYTNQTPPMESSTPPNTLPRRAIPGKWHPHYEMVLNALIVDPYITQRALAEQLCISAAWLCQIINSDMFKERLRERRAEINSAVANGIAGKIVYAADLALDRSIERLENNKASEAFEGSTRDSMLSRLGYVPNPGARSDVEEQANPAQKAWLAHKATLAESEELIEGDFKELAND